MNQIVYKLVVSEIEPKRGVVWFNPNTGLTQVFYNDKWIPLGKGINYNEVLDKIKIPTKLSQFTNDAGYLTQHQSLNNYYTKTEVDQTIENAIAEYDYSANSNTGVVDDGMWTKIIVYTGAATITTVNEEENVIYELPGVTYTELLQAIQEGKLVHVVFPTVKQTFIASSSLLNYYFVNIAFIYMQNAIPDNFIFNLLDIQQGANDSIVLTPHVLNIVDALNAKANANNVYTKVETDTQIGNMLNSTIAGFAAVASSGSYTDLTDAPQFVTCTQAEYDAMSSYDSNTYYIIVEDGNS